MKWSIKVPNRRMKFFYWYLMSNKCCSLTDARAIFDLRRSVNCGAHETEASSWLIHVIEPYCSSSSWITSLHSCSPDQKPPVMSLWRWHHRDTEWLCSFCTNDVNMTTMWSPDTTCGLHLLPCFHHQYRMSVTVSAVTLSYFYIT